MVLFLCRNKAFRNRLKILLSNFPEERVTEPEGGPPGSNAARGRQGGAWAPSYHLTPPLAINLLLT